MAKKSTPPRYAELQVTTNFSFLRGASHGEELVAQAHALGLAAIAVTDRNTLSGVVRAHLAAKELGLKLIVGARLDLQDAPSLLCLPRDRQAYGRLSRLLSLGQRRAKKGECILYLEDVAQHAEGQIFIALAPDDWDWRACAAPDTSLTRHHPSPRATSTPSPLGRAERVAVFSLPPSWRSHASHGRGGGSGWGVCSTGEVVHHPLPDPPPQGGREKKRADCPRAREF